MTNAILWAIAIIILLAAVVALFAWWYERATNEVSLVKTGIGGRKVVMDGGTIAVPYFHEISRINMQTLRLDVHRAGESALITKDRLRVDVGVEFYLSVIPTAEGIARAAQTLGRRTFQADQLRNLIDGMLVDALRSVAARLTMDELHENRGAFVADVRSSLTEALARYGLQLDAVSLTALDQTPFSALDENNAFNAVGMRKLAEVIANSRKERAEIDADADVSVRRAAMEATKRKLQIDLEEREAEIAQQQEIETMLAAQLAEVARRKAEGEREAAQARIQMEKEIQAAEITRERDLAIAEQDREIATAAKSQEESKARAAADAARAEAVKAAEAITTAHEVAEAERRREVALVAARQEAEAEASRMRIAAEAEKETAGDRAAARREDADARKYEQLADAEAARARIEAENMRAEHIVAMETDLARLNTLPKVVAEMVKPAEKIDSIDIHHFSGFGRTDSGGSWSGGERSVMNQAIDSIMEMAVQMPALKRIGEEIGLGVIKRSADTANKNNNEDKKAGQD